MTGASSLAAGARGRLTVEGFANPLDFDVRNTYDGNVHVAFTREPDQAWQKFVARYENG